MERKDLLLANAAIFSAQGKAMNEVAERNIKVLVVGNPANTNALIARANAPDLNPRNFTAMTRLDHNRALAQLSEKTGCHTTDIRRLTIWGNHSSTQYPDINHATVGGQPAIELVDQAWLEGTFIPVVQQRDVGVTEGDLGVIGGGDAVQQRERAIVELHDHALQRRQRRRDLEQVQVDRLIRSQQMARGNAKGKGIADLASGTGDRDGQRLLHDDSVGMTR